MRIITLSEDTAGLPDDILGEHGLSILIEGEKKILFDTGQSISAVRNADTLGIDLKDIDTLVLSHGHHDHTGGLKEVLMRTGSVDVIAHPDIFQRKYAKRPNERERYIGIPFLREKLENMGARFELHRDPVGLKDLMTSGEIERRTNFEEVEKYLYVKEGNTERRDELLDDQALAIETEEGLFVILGCAHAGIINTLEHFVEITGEHRIYGVIGGTHLAHASDKQLKETIKALKNYDIKKIGVSHCTGMRASMILANEFKEKFFLNNAGSVIEIR
jgi:7,8-dihydropterin-6-yl-methyl-4-(beta-D-ribofuranosyl)aminobenzene 5'-phosphate synthase